MTMIQSVWPSMRIQPAVAVKKVRRPRVRHEQILEDKTRCVNDEKI